MEHSKEIRSFFLKGLPKEIRICQKLDMLEKEWPGVVGPEYAKRSMIAGCEIENGCALLTIHAESAAVATSMGPFKNKLPRALRVYLEVDSVKVSIKVGKVQKASETKAPAPAYKRRAPVVISDAALSEALEQVKEEISDPELAEAMARLKAVLARLQARN